MEVLNAVSQVSLEAARRARSAKQPKAEAAAEPKETFKKSEAAPKEQPPKGMVSYLPQDEGMLPPAQAPMDFEPTSGGPANERFKVSVPRNMPVARPDENGNMVYDLDDPRFDSTNTFYTANRALEVAEGYLGREIPWGFSNDLERQQMLIHPHAGGNTANAFYHSEAGSINFFHFTDPSTSELHRTGTSADIVAHETGHAVLDGIRHNYLSSLTVSAGGFHESFGDMLAILVALNDPTVVEALQQETQGNLAIPNLVSGVAENLGSVAGKMDGIDTDCLRQALNSHKYKDQHFLPYIDPKDPFSGLGQEPHAYANLFTGAFYEVLFGLYSVTSSDTSRSFADALGEARDMAGMLLMRGTEFAPVGEPTYREVALAMLKADQVDFDGALRPLLESVFVGRKIISQADLEAFDKHEAALPKLTLDRAAIESEEAALEFLDNHRDELKLGKDLPFEFDQAHTNNRGETFVLYKYYQDVDLEGPDYGVMEGARARMNGGLVLAFDAEGKLFASNHDKVTEREIEEVKNHLKSAVSAEMLVASGLTPRSDSASARCEPGDRTCKHGKFASQYLQLNVVSEGGKPVLRRSPIVTC
ncbi:MAG: hypothetical protein AMXMBFR33_56860 [Candidatus Xenobia bacterium]